MKRNNILKILLSSLSFSACFSLILFKNININAEEVDYSYPITDNSQKDYESNIPNEWYDENKNYGKSTSGYSFDLDISYSGCDFISLDGQTNYANQSYIVLSVGETLDFYMEMGFVGWTDSTPQNYYKIDLSDNHPIGDDVETKIISFEITQKYGDTIDTIFTYNPLGNTVFDSADAYNSDPIKNMFYADDGEGNVFENGYYHLPKFSIVAEHVGFFALNVEYGTGSGLWSNQVQSLAIFVTEDYYDDPIKLPFNAINNTYNVYYFENDIELVKNGETVIALPISCTPIYSFKSEFELYDIVSNSALVCCEITSKDSNAVLVKSNTIYFKKPGYYDLDVRYTMKLNDNEFEVYSGTVKVFAYNSDSFQLVNYDLNNVVFKENEENEVDNYFSFNIGIDSEYFLPSSIYMDYGTENETEVFYGMYVELGTHQITAFIRNDDYTNFITRYESLTLTTYPDAGELTKEYTFGVYDTNYLYPEPILNKEDYLEVNLLDLPYFVSDICIENFDDIEARHGEVTYSLNECTTRTLERYDYSNPYFELVDDIQYGYNVLDIKVAYPNNKFHEVYFTFYIESNGITFGIEKNKVNIRTCSEGKVGLSFYDQEGNCYPLSELMEALYSYEKEYLQIELYSENGLLSEYYLDENGYFNFYVGEISGTETDIIQIKFNDVTLAAFLLQVNIVGEGESQLNVTLNFEQGESIRVLLEDAYIPALTIPYPYNEYNFAWLSLNSNIVVVEASPDGTSAHLIPTGVGTTEVMAIYQDNEGYNIIVKSTICVIDEIPDVTISFSKNNDETGYTIYDLINVSVNSHGFTFSNQVSYEWYLDGTKLTLALDALGNNVALNNVDNFYLKMAEGLHEFKVEIVDSFYNINIEGNKQISIGTIANQERTLSFASDEIFMITSGSSYDLEVLLDGVINNEFNYLWTIDDTTIAKIYYSGEPLLTIIPLKAGETKIVVFTNIGKYEDKIIRAEIKLIIEDLSSMSIAYDNDYPKPGNNIVANIIINGNNDCKNLSNVVYKIKHGEDDVKFENEGSKIIINDTVSGKYYINVSYNDVSASSSIRCTNFNFKKIFLSILPYTLGLLVLLIIGFAIYKFFDNPIKNALRASTKLQEAYNESIEFAKTNESIEEICKRYKVLHRKAVRLLNVLNYYHDEGVDEFGYSLKQIIVLEKELRALKEYGYTIPLENANKAIEIMNDTIVVPAAKMVEQAVNSRLQYENGIKQQNKDEAKAYRESSKHKGGFKLFKKNKTERDYLYETGLLNKEKAEESSDK